MCYILDPMRAEVAKFVRMGVSTGRACAKIHKMNGETCALRHATSAAPDWRALRRAVAGRAGVVYE